jgi:hypothetical protein
MPLAGRQRNIEPLLEQAGRIPTNAAVYCPVIEADLPHQIGER